MARVLCYTSPARGHLFPTVPILRELAARGHDVVVLTLRDEVARVEGLGVRARPIGQAIEDIAMDDYLGGNPKESLDRAVRVFVQRAEHEIDDLKAAIAQERPDLVLVDFNSWGAAAVAEASGLPWALFMPYFLPWSLPGVPPFGPGLAPRSDVFGRARDWVVGKAVHGLMNRNLGAFNAVRARVGLPGLAHITEQGRSAPCVLHFTAEPFDYPCAARPANVVMIGPSAWEPESATPPWLPRDDRPLVLVTCSTEFQDDGAIVRAALEGLADEDVFVIATTGAIDLSSFSAPKNARVERFVAHGPLLARATAVVCHGGMGITQKALAAGVPVCVVPFGRDQLEVARRVEVASAGVRLAPSRLSPATLREAVRETRARKPGAERIAEGFRAAGGVRRAVGALERLLEAERVAC